MDTANRESDRFRSDEWGRIFDAAWQAERDRLRDLCDDNGQVALSPELIAQIETVWQEFEEARSAEYDGLVFRQTWPEWTPGLDGSDRTAFELMIMSERKDRVYRVLRQRGYSPRYGGGDYVYP